MTKAAKTRLMVFGSLSVIFIFAFFISLLSYSVNLYQLNKEKTQLESKYEKLQEEAEDLKIEITKLQDPEYLAKFARENYLYSKEGELIIKINKTEKALEETQTQIESNQSVIIVSVCIIILIFLYITIKSATKKKSD